MAFQNAVFLQQGFGVTGELFNNSPVISDSYILTSLDASYNVVGRGFSVSSEGVAAAGNVGGLLPFAGILANPKVYPSFGTSSDTLAPTLTLPNYINAELVTMGKLVVTLPAAALINDLVVYDNTTGILSTISPGAALPVGKSFAYAQVCNYTITAAGLAVIQLIPTLPIPVLA